MLNIAICDDDKNMIEQISNILWKHRGEIYLEWKSYLSGEELLKAMKEGCDFDLIFLDIEMKKLSGIDVADILRNELNDYSTQIAFVTNKENRSKEACKVQPIDYIDKPVDEEKILPVIDKTIKIVGDNRRYFAYIKDGEQRRILNKDIYYFKSDEKTITIISTIGNDRYKGSLKDIEEKLGDYGFFRTNKSYIINSKNVEYLAKDGAKMMNGETVPVSRDYKKKLSRYGWI